MKYLRYISHLSKKFFFLCLLKFFKQFEFQPGIVVFCKKNITKDKRFILYLNDDRYMHPGDHLFFEPLARWLKEIGLQVIVLPTSPMRSYFRQKGYATDIEITSNDIIITRPEMYFSVRKTSRSLILVHSACSDIQKPLTNYLIETFAKLLEIKFDFLSFDCKPASLSLSHDRCVFPLSKNENYVLFSNYIASGKFRIGSKKRNAINTFARVFKARHNCKLIHIGSISDRDYDQQVYDFIDIDLRGKTSIDDLFYLASLSQVSGAISFDNFIMHLMFINEKKSFVLFRGRWTAKAHNYHLKCINPPFTTDKSLIEYISV